jgi:hypothetical protein
MAYQWKAVIENGENLNGANDENENIQQCLINDSIKHDIISGNNETSK